MAGELDRNVMLGVGLDTSGVEAGAAKFTEVVKGMGATGAAAGAQFSAGFQPATVDVGRLINSIQRLETQYQKTGQLSAEALVPLGVQLKEITAQFAQTTEGTAALSKTQQDVLKTAQGYFESAVTRLREYNAEVKRIKDSLAKPPAAPVVPAAPTLSPAFEKQAKQIETVNKGLTETGIIGPRNLAALAVSIKDAERRFDKLTEAERRSLASAKTLYSEAIKKQREFNDQMEQVSRQTRNFTSLEGALVSMGGTIGKLTTGVVGFFAAWKGGQRVGADIRESIIALFPEFEKMSEGWADRVADMALVWSDFLKGVVRKTKDADLPSLLTPQGPRGEATKFKVDLESATAAVGLKSLGMLNAELAAFSDKIRVAELNGKALGSVFEENKGQVEGLVKGFRSYGQSVPLLEGVVRGWEAVTAAQEASKKAAQEAARAAEEAIKRAEALAQALHGGGRLLDMRGKRPFGEIPGPSPELLDQIAEQKRRDTQVNIQAESAASAKRAEDWKRANEEIIKNWNAAFDKFTTDMADVFTAGVIGGAEGFADAASRLFLEQVNDGAKGIFKSLGKLIFGAAPDRGDFTAGPMGEEQYNRALTESNLQNQKIMGVVAGAVGAIGDTLRMFQNAKLGQQVSVLGTTLSFAAAGASIGSLFPGLGTIIGAAVGAIVGAVVGLLANAKAKASQPFAAYGIREGEAFVEPFKGKEGNFANISELQLRDMLATITKTMESITNDYIKLLMKLPDATAEFIKTLSVSSGRNTQKQFMEDFQNWIENTLPQQIIDTFRDPLSKGFEGLGLSAERFLEIWNRLRAIDPKQAIGALNELFDALTAFQKVMADQGRELYGGPGFEFDTGYLSEAQAKANQSFAEQIAEASIALIDFGESIELLTGPEQITQAKAWGDALLQRQEAVKQFFQQVALAIDNVIRGYQSSIRDLTLQGFKTESGAPDVGAQVGYLKSYADQLYQQIQNAPTMEAATALSAELQRVILQIQQIGGAQGVEAAEAYRLWAIEQLKAAQDLVVKRLQDLAQAVADQEQRFLDAIQKFIDAFLGAAGQLTGETTEETPNEVPPPTSRRPDQQGEDPWDWNRRNRGANVYDFPTGESATLSQRRGSQGEDFRELVRLTRENNMLMRQGRDIRVSGQADVFVQDQNVGSIPLDSDPGGFERRTINGRFRAS